MWQFRLPFNRPDVGLNGNDSFELWSPGSKSPIAFLLVILTGRLGQTDETVYGRTSPFCWENLTCGIALCQVQSNLTTQ